jgi:AcrR family transcriptional regulator
MTRPNAARRPPRQQPADEPPVDGRRTDTKNRIHDVALAVFSERGWDGATLREIADRLEITRPALYYHYRSKEDILASIHRDLAHSVDGLLDWARAQPATAATRTEILHRLAALMAGPLGTFIAFAQANEAAMRNLTAAEEFAERMDSLADLLKPSETVAGRMKARLALDALFMAGSRRRQLGGSDSERCKAALATATSLIGA